MPAHISRRLRAGLALLGSVWSLLTLPLVAATWSGGWVAELSRTPPYRAIAALVDDPYIVFGTLGFLSFLAIGLALLPDLRRAGWGGTTMVALVLAGAVVTVLSYLGTPDESPLHPLWGAEGYLLLGVGAAGIAAAITAGRGWRIWTRVLLGATILVLAAGMLAFGYYPHGSLIVFGVEAAALVLGAPRAGTKA